MEKLDLPSTLRVFISSKDYLEDERTTVEKAVSDLHMIPIRTETTYWLATRYLDEYLRQVKKSDIVILLLEESNRNVSDFDEFYKYVKEEIDIAFNRGKAILLFVKQSTNNTQFNEFLTEVKFKVFARKFKTCIELYETVRKSLLYEIYRKYASNPIFIGNRKTLYECTNMYLSKIQYRVFISENTPGCLLGPRKGIQFEKELHNTLFSFLEQVKKKEKKIRIFLLFNINKTKEELQVNKQNYETNLFRENCDRLRSVLSENMAVVGVSEEIVPFIVCDNMYIIGPRLEKRVIALLDNSPEVVKELEKMVNYFTSELNDQGITKFEEILSEMNIS